MKVREFANMIKAQVLTGEAGMDKDILSIYSCDLLSWVMSNAGKASAWVTVHTHLNTVAVALMVEIPCIIVVEGIPVEEATIKKAIAEDIAILSTDMDAFEVCWRGHGLLQVQK